MDPIEMQDYNGKKVKLEVITKSPLAESIRHFYRIVEGYLGLFILRLRGYPDFKQYPISEEPQNQPSP